MYKLSIDNVRNTLKEQWYHTPILFGLYPTLLYNSNDDWQATQVTRIGWALWLGRFLVAVPTKEVPFDSSRNISRDFSDATMMAEVIGHHFPKIVELHNYPPTNSLKSKLANWTTLNSTISFIQIRCSRSWVSPWLRQIAISWARVLLGRSRPCYLSSSRLPWRI